MNNNLSKQDEEAKKRRLYLGYEGIGLDGFNPNRIPVKQISKLKNPIAERLIKQLSREDILIVKKGAQDFFINNSLQISDIWHLSIAKQSEVGKKIIEKYQKGEFKTYEQIVDFINSNLHLISPFDLPIVYTPGHAMIGKINKPLIIPNNIQCSNRKVYFSNICLGQNLNKISESTLVHEVAHSQMERHLSYTKDYLNKEIVSIFLEKVNAYQKVNVFIPESLKLLEISEQMRLNYMIDCIQSLPNSKGVDYINNLLYIKSTLYATQLFDIYQSSSLEGRKKLMEDIQSLFDGKIQVEEIISKYKLNFKDSTDLELIKKHTLKS